MANLPIRFLSLPFLCPTRKIAIARSLRLGLRARRGLRPTTYAHQQIKALKRWAAEAGARTASKDDELLKELRDY